LKWLAYLPHVYVSTEASSRLPRESPHPVPLPQGGEGLRGTILRERLKHGTYVSAYELSPR